MEIIIPAVIAQVWETPKIIFLEEFLHLICIIFQILSQLPEPTALSNLGRGSYLIEFQRLVEQNSPFLPVVSLVPNGCPDQLIILLWLLIAQFDPQGAHMGTRHVIPEGHAVGRVLGIDHRAHQAGHFALLIFISLGIDEVAISCCDKELC